MRILFTGASSFTGYWFVKLLVEAGHTIVAPLRAPLESYDTGPRAERVRRLAKAVDLVGSAPFGSETFLDVVRSGTWDIFCHHAARVTDYKNPDFDIAGALAENTFNLRRVLSDLSERALSGIVVTGSVFEQDEGAGYQPLHAFSAYGLSKGLTFQTFRLRCHEMKIPLGKFVIPNPFGPLEDPRFCAYLVKSWKAGGVAAVNTPDYLRDNIHVDLLSLAYADFVTRVADGTSLESRLNPSGYVESQGSFALRYAAAMRHRLDLPCALTLAKQTNFDEPLMRVNTQSAAASFPSWQEENAWDAVAEAVRAV